MVTQGPFWQHDAQLFQFEPACRIAEVNIDPLDLAPPLSHPYCGDHPYSHAPVQFEGAVLAAPYFFN